ncbi:Polyribonucleotide nucleotidyltransferase [Parasponia andersonii]|uniref:Polyribonucleotide nucleotidyltransferase n=1 Tax=Parasponia andersonii TaxID=3476 RepID=A0A2P5BV68_PARAD|nr:Polyribonucleotide nucleotidyltransferase [Parasponia andersonii]
MQILVQPCKCSSSSLPLNSFDFVHNTLESSTFCGFLGCPVPKTAYLTSFSTSRSLVFSRNFPVLRSTQLSFCSRNEVFDAFSSTHLSNKSEEDSTRENGEFGLLDKPCPVLKDDNNSDNGSASEVGGEKVDEDEALAPFLKFFSSADGMEELKEEEVQIGVSEEKSEVDDEGEGEKKVKIEYYEPKPGDFVVGVVVSGNENKLDVNVGADLLGTMLTKEALPLYDKEMDYLLCDPSLDAEDFFVSGKMGVVQYDDAVSEGPMSGKPVVEVGTLLFAEVLGRTLSGRPLLSTRRLFRRIAWHRVRQIKQLNEPIEVRITEWNTGGILTRIEGLRAFLPKAELLKRVNNFGELKEKVGCRMYVLISRINESKNDLILSEKEAWQMSYLREGTLLEGTVKKIFPFGAQISIGETNRRGLLHISNITRGHITAVSDLLAVDEKVKVLVVKSMFPEKISLSTADLESEPGLFITNKERVFSEAETMAKKYREKLPVDLAAGIDIDDPLGWQFDMVSMDRGRVLPWHPSAILVKGK